MKRIGITQRVENITEYNKRRDCLDQKWAQFLFSLGMLPVILPNLTPDQLESCWKHLALNGVILSGGNSLSAYEPKSVNAAPERDCFEAALIDKAIADQIPIIGVCRGMQMINVHFGGKLSPCVGQAGVRHPLVIKDEAYNSRLYDEVNSFHNYAIASQDLAAGAEVIACDPNKNIEAIFFPEKHIYGIMWHPERQAPFLKRDQQLIKDWLI